MKLPLWLAAVAIALPLSAAQSETSASAIRRVPRPEAPGTAWSVRAPDGTLVFTEQIFAQKPAADAAAQANDMLDYLGAVLAKSGAKLHDVVRLNVYVADDSVTPAVDAVLARRFVADPPAVSLIRSPLARPEARVACDAVAVGTRAGRGVTLGDGFAVMPAGGKIFISGQAKRAGTLAASVAQTMEALHASLVHLGRSKADVVYVKGFITPFADQATARAEIAKTFGERAPPIVLIEWLADSPTEIELVAAAPGLVAKDGEPAAFLGLPGMTNSPYYSRVTTVAAGAPLIFISGIDGGPGGDARQQWQRVYAQLAAALLDAGSSFRHMVKATYYLSDAKARPALGDIRGVYYDPTRPPAASALDVKSLGRPGRLVALDMIAVPAKSGTPK